MTDTLTSYRLIARDLPTALKRKAADPVIARETAYYEAHIGKVKSIDDLFADPRLYAYAMKAHGLEEMTYAKAFMRKVVSEGVDGRASFASRLADDRYVAFAQAFRFGGTASAAGRDPATFGLAATAATLSASQALPETTDFSGPRAARFLVESRLEAGTTRSVTITLDAKTLAGRVDDLTQVSREQIAAAINAQIVASGAEGLAGTVQVGVGVDKALFFETTAVSDLGVDEAVGGIGANADRTVAAGGAGRTLSIRNVALADPLGTAVDLGFGTGLGPDGMARSVTEAYLQQALESDAGAEDTGVRLALYFARKAPTLLSAYDILGDAALSQVANTVSGLPATSGAATSEALTRRAALIASKVDIASLKDPVKLDAFVRRFAAIWDAQNNTQTAPILALFSAGGIDAELLASVQTTRGTR
ncbi:DUF1217 domain-containing protein [Methylobacterium sp. Leaf118]|uniref:DUF1217 domain-containing protein n=1 Tax=Methylobacterium sp. Leaf118 TaxID=2876562 RepID=UPI001E28F59E|nr:DUF1217 domain-containing protein [Methylobacterium sp. Leaf118]